MWQNFPFWIIWKYHFSLSFPRKRYCSYSWHLHQHFFSFSAHISYFQTFIVVITWVLPFLYIFTNSCYHLIFDDSCSNWSRVISWFWLAFLWLVIDSRYIWLGWLEEREEWGHAKRYTLQLGEINLRDVLYSSVTVNGDVFMKTLKRMNVKCSHHKNDSITQ